MELILFLAALIIIITHFELALILLASFVIFIFMKSIFSALYSDRTTKRKLEVDTPSGYKKEYVTDRDGNKISIVYKYPRSDEVPEHY